MKSTLATLCYSLGITLPKLFEGIVAVMPPVAEGGIKRRSNQATLDKPAQLGTRRHSFGLKTNERVLLAVSQVLKGL